MVATSQRFSTASHPCPICGGYDRKPRGHGERCSGYESEDGEYVYCTREEYAGALERNEDTEPASFLHKMHGRCNCGKEHGPAKVTPFTLNGHKKQEQVPLEYSYQDEQGRLAYQVLRYEPKDFKQRRPDGKGGWIWSMQGVKRVPYRLPALLKAPMSATVYIVEGEKDADRLTSLGLVATCNVGGAGKWEASYNQHFKGRRVVILPDNDKAGRDHAAKVKKELAGVASYLNVIELPALPDKGDVSDWLAAGGTREALLALTTPPKRKFTYACDVEEKDIEWLWEGRLAKGCLTLGVGDPGLGKGLTLAAVIRAVTRGEALPGGPDIPCGGVILMSPEDPTSQVLIPRLKAAGVNLTKVILLNEIEETDPTTGDTYKRPTSFPEDVAILREAIEDNHATLVVIDPILSLLSGKVDAHKNHAVRQALAQVISTAESHDCAVLGIMHLNRSNNANVLYRSSSSNAFIEMARTALYFVPDPDGEQGQSGVIVNYKNNLAKHATSIRYTIHQTAKNIGYIRWNGESGYSRDELLNQNTANNNKKSEREDDIVAVLKSNQEAMSLQEILPHTTQEAEALKKMLARKVDAGILCRTSRGKYTYPGNPLYINDVPNVPNVPMSQMSQVEAEDNRDIKRDMSLSENGTDNAPHAASDNRDIWDMENTATDELQQLYRLVQMHFEAHVPSGSTLWRVDGSGFKQEMCDKSEYGRRLILLCKSPSEDKRELARHEMQHLLAGRPKEKRHG